MLSNAIKFTERGEVELRVSVESTDKQQCKLRFGVRDTGIGISSAQQQLIFSAFGQADSSISRRFGGTGLGLSISMQLVELMGGHLQVSSEVGQGSEFWFVLPLQRDQRVERRPTELARLELLIADDCASVREALAVVANSLGWLADTAASGEAALMQTLTRLNGKRFYDAIVLDWKMPGLGGLNAAKAIRQALKDKRRDIDPPILLMVAAHLREDLFAAGTTMAITKALFQDGSGEFKWLAKPAKADRLQYANLMAMTLLEPDEIWWIWVRDDKEKGRWRLKRRYLRAFEIDGSKEFAYSVFEWKSTGWDGSTVFMGSQKTEKSREKYFDGQRDGRLMFKK